MKRLACMLCLSALGAFAQAQEAPAEQVAVAETRVERIIGKGIASWYGERFHGRKTASGERFDMDQLTAAHRTLPFGTIVKVRSLANGREVEVRINDRGPHIKRRVIDLSRGAAKALGLLDGGAGTRPVQISVLD